MATADSKKDPDFDVAVIGYGPVGQSLAILLGQLGLRACVFERWTTLYHLPRAVHYDHETARILQHMGIGEEAARQAYSEISMKYLNPERQLLMRHVSGGMGVSGWPVSNMFYQPDLERLLDRRAGEFPNVERRLGWTVTAVSEDADGVTVTAKQADGAETMSVRARYVVGCDGANSFLRRHVGAAEADLNFYHDWLVVSGEVKSGEIDSWGVQLCDPYRPQTYVPVGPHRVRFEFMLRPEETAEQMNREDTAWKLMEPWGFTPENTILERHAVYTFSGKWSLNWRKGRLMIAGDAAHQTPPFLGQGMCSGIRDVFALAWRLKLVLDGLSPDSILDTYTSERVPHIAEIVGKAVELGGVLCVTDPEAAAARDAAMVAQANDVPLVLSWRMGPGLFRPDDEAAGWLSPQAKVRHGGREALLDDLTGTPFRLLTTLPESEVRKAADLGYFDRLGGRVVSFAGDYEDVTGAFTAWLKDLGAAAVLVRPDFNNFGMAASSEGLPSLFKDLETALSG